MRYLRAGSGPPLVLIHGLLGHSFSWRFALPVFAEHFTVYSVDLLGAGYSERPAGLDQSLRANADRLLRFLDQVGIGSCVLLGSSRGGGVAMRAAAQAPERVQRMVLVSPINPWSAHGKRLAPILSNPVLAPLTIRVMRRGKALYPLILRRLYGDGHRIRPGTLEGYAAPYEIPGSFENEIAILSTWNRDLEDLRHQLPRIAHIPTLLLWGDRDVAVAPSSAVPLGRNFTDCHLIMMEGVGHIPYEEVPEDFHRAVLSFLTKP